MKPLGIKAIGNLTAILALAMLLGYDVAGWPSTCVLCTASNWNYVYYGLCQGQQCEGVVGGGCSTPCVMNSQYLCTDNHQTQVSFINCTKYANGNCSYITDKETVNYGEYVNCP